MNNIVLNVYRPKIKNAVWAVCYAAIVAVCVVILIIDITSEPETVSEKIINCTVFSLFLCVGVLMLGATANCIRNIFSEPVITLDNDEITVCRKGTFKVCDVQGIEIPPKKNKITFTMKNGESFSVKQSSLAIPVDTVAYAVNIRLKQK